MSNAIYPDLPGMTIDVSRTPRWKTSIKQSVSGREVRAAHQTYPTWDFTLSYEFLRSSGAHQELQAIVGFFNARRGSYDDFLFSVPEDNAVADFQFGVGDGSTTQYQLIKSLGGFVEPTYDVKGTPTIKVNDAPISPVTEFNVSSTGIVVFTSAPPVGASLKWTGEYYQRVRFGNDSVDFERFLYQLWKLKKVELRSVKP